MKIVLLLIASILYLTSYSQTTSSLTITPNPFSDSTSIDFYLAKNDTVKIEVFNAIGQSISVLVNDSSFLSGQHAIMYQSQLTPEGIYIVTMTLKQDSSRTKRIIKLNQTSPTDSLLLPTTFDSTLNFRFYIANNDTVTGFAYDRWGILLNTILYRTNLPPGHYDYPINTSTWVNGSYFFILKLTGNRQITTASTKTQGQNAIMTLKSELNENYIYPNPAKDFINLSKPFIGKIKIINSIGSTIKIIQVDNEPISIKELPKGLYYIEIINSTENIGNIKMVKE